MPTISEIIEELKKSGVNSKQKAIEMLEELLKNNIVLVLDREEYPKRLTTKESNNYKAFNPCNTHFDNDMNGTGDYIVGGSINKLGKLEDAIEKALEVSE